MARLMVRSMFTVLFRVLIFVSLNLCYDVSGPSLMSTSEGRGWGGVRKGRLAWGLQLNSVQFFCVCCPFPFLLF